MALASPTSIASSPNTSESTSDEDNSNNAKASQQHLDTLKRESSHTSKTTSSRRISLKKTMSKRLSSILKRRKSSTSNIDISAITEEEMLSKLWTMKQSIVSKRQSDLSYAANLKINILEAPPDNIACDIDPSRILYPTISLGKASGSRRVSHPNSKFQLNGSTRTDLMDSLQSLSSVNRRLSIVLNTCDFPNDSGLYELLSMVNQRHLLESFTIQVSNSYGGPSLLKPIFQTFLPTNPNLTSLNLKLWEGSKCLIDSDHTASIIQQALSESKTLKAVSLDYHPQRRVSVTQYNESYFQTVTQGIASNNSIEVLTLALFDNNRLVELLAGHSTLRMLHIRGPYKGRSSIDDDLIMLPYKTLIESPNCKLEVLKLSGQGLRCCHIDTLLSVESSSDPEKNHPLQELDVSQNAIEKLDFPKFIKTKNPHPWKLIKAYNNPVSTEFYTCQTYRRHGGVRAAMFQHKLNTQTYCEQLLPLIRKCPDLVVDWLDDQHDIYHCNEDGTYCNDNSAPVSVIEKLMRFDMENIEDRCLLDRHFLTKNDGLAKTLAEMPLLGPALFEKTHKILRSQGNRNLRAQRQANLIHELWVKTYLPQLLLERRTAATTEEEVSVPATTKSKAATTVTSSYSIDDNAAVAPAPQRGDSRYKNTNINTSYDLSTIATNENASKDDNDVEEELESHQIRSPRFAIVQMKKPMVTIHDNGYSDNAVFEIICHYDRLIESYGKYSTSTAAAAATATTDTKSSSTDSPTAREKRMSLKRRSSIKKLLTRRSSKHQVQEEEDNKNEGNTVTILETQRIFSSFTTSEYASPKLLKEMFGTDNVVSIAKHILEDGAIVHYLL